MAGTLTHAYFVMDLYDKLGIKSKELLIGQKELLKTCAQSMDVLYFYNIMNFKKGKKIRDFGYYFHEAKTYEFFYTLANYIKYSGYQYNPQVMAFFYGMLSHYVLDSNMHPYVVYKTGEYIKNEPSTYKYNHLHSKMETYFDDYMVRTRNGILPHKFKCFNFCLNTTSFNKELIDVIDHIYKEVFKIENFHKYYLKSISEMKLFYRIFRYDPVGVKRLFYKGIDLVSPLTFLKKEPLSFKMKMSHHKWFLNLDHKVWYNPTDKRTKSNNSLLEIYTSSLDKTVNMINSLNQFFYYSKKIDLKKVIGNNSYVTGKDLDKKRELKYFEF